MEIFQKFHFVIFFLLNCRVLLHKIKKIKKIKFMKFNFVMGLSYSEDSLIVAGVVLTFDTVPACDGRTDSVGIAGGEGVQPPSSSLRPSQFDLFVCLGGSENNPPDRSCIHCLCHHSTIFVSLKILYTNKVVRILS